MWIKICGIRDLQTAMSVAALEPDAIGLNFYAQTPRCVAKDIAAHIVQELPPSVEPVGLFVNHSLEDVVETATECRLQTLQFHGDEPPEYLAEICEKLPDARIIRAYRLAVDGWREVVEDDIVCHDAQVNIWAHLVDAHVQGAYGGTGHTVEQTQLQEYDREQFPRLILAGGLNPENVADAIRAVHPWGVDVSSGVESSPGEKDLARVEAFIQQARIAFEEIESQMM